MPENLRFSQQFLKQYKKLDGVVRQRADKSIEQFMNDKFHPSLHFEKLKGYDDIYSLRVNRNFRILLRKLDDCFECFKIDTHDLYNRL